MDHYLVIKSVVMAAALIGAFGYFFHRIRHLFRLMTAVQGKAETSIDHIRDRIRVFFTDVLGQSNVRRKPFIGAAHTMIFIGFLAVQPHSLELMIKGVFPGFDLGNAIPHVYTAYLFLTDILAFLVLPGLLYALYRRLFVRPRYLTMGRDANLILSVHFSDYRYLSLHQCLSDAAAGIVYWF